MTASAQAGAAATSRARPVPLAGALAYPIKFFALLIRPWIRDRRMPWDGMLMLCLLTMWVQDSMCNYFNFTFM